MKTFYNDNINLYDIEINNEKHPQWILNAIEKDYPKGNETLNANVI